MRTILMLALAGALLTPAAFADRKWNDNRRDNRYRYDDRRDNRYRYDDRRFDRDYYGNLPPGLQRRWQKKGTLPPGLQRKWQRQGTLPRGWDRRNYQRWDRDDWRDRRDRRFRYDWRNQLFNLW